MATGAGGASGAGSSSPEKGDAPVCSFAALCVVFRRGNLVHRGLFAADP